MWVLCGRSHLLCFKFWSCKQERHTNRSPWQDHVAGGLAHSFTVKERKSSELWEILEAGKGIQYLISSQLPDSASQNPQVPLWEGTSAIMIAEGWLIPDVGIHVLLSWAGLPRLHFESNTAFRGEDRRVRGGPNLRLKEAGSTLGTRRPREP